MYRIATRHGPAGSVCNPPGGVVLDGIVPPADCVVRFRTIILLIIFSYCPVGRVFIYFSDDG
jgi:hypothetical protein